MKDIFLFFSNIVINQIIIKFKSKVNRHMIKSLCSQQIQQKKEKNCLHRKQQPYKIKILKALGLADIILHKFIITKKRETYHFPKKYYRVLKNKQSDIPLLYFPHNFPSSSTLLIYSHGNGSNLNQVYSFAHRLYHMYNIAVIAYDYTGFGQSKKKQVNFQNDITVVLAWALKLGYDIKRCILAGFSIGSYSALYLKGVMPRVLIAPISGLISFIEGQIAHYDGQIYDNIQLASQLESRIFMVHSSVDKIPIEHSKILYNALTKNRSNHQINRICYIQIDELTHEEMINFFILEENREFRKFLHEIIKQGTKLKLCQRTLRLIDHLTIVGKTLEVSL